ncbi:MAG: hypothetical protein NTW52_16500 [Planctomycetota bacterium]|nr:hypothetical protein [Planctomycetota bacterium]
MNLKSIHPLVFAITLHVALLCISAIGVLGLGDVAFGEQTTQLFDLSKFDASNVTTTHATVTTKGDAVSIHSDDQRVQATVQFDVPAALRDLSKWGIVEIDLENTGDKPLRFSFWALSGNGWGGVSTWSTRSEMLQPPTPDKPKPSGIELLGPKERRTFQIDLHACYPKPDASGRFYTIAIDPASVRWLKLVLGDRGEMLIHGINISGSPPKVKREHFNRTLVPDIERDAPMAGKRVYQKLPGWESTTVEHVLTLPKDWKPGAKFPIIVEYTGNVFYDKWCHSTGVTDQGNLAYGLSRGETFILLNLPFISTDAQREEPNGWGSIEKTEDYCLQALKFVSEHYGGDANQIFYTGFSRGELAMNYLALRDERIAPIWRGFIGADPAIPASKKWLGSPGWKNCATGWDERGARLQDRPFISQHPDYGPVHVDLEYLEDSPSTVAVRAWLQRMLDPTSQ